MGAGSERTWNDSSCIFAEKAWGTGEGRPDGPHTREYLVVQK